MNGCGWERAAILTAHQQPRACDAFEETLSRYLARKICVPRWRIMALLLQVMQAANRPADGVEQLLHEDQRKIVQLSVRAEQPKNLRRCMLVSKNLNNLLSH